jgi:UDP-glucose 4-epimerase
MDATHMVYGGKRVLVTGGAGFIGSNLVRQLADLGAIVTVVDSLIPDYGGNMFNLSGYEDRIRINIADVRDPYSMSHLVGDQDYLFNLAGQVSHSDSMQSPLTDLDINVRAQVYILEACRRFRPSIRVVFTSTRQVYGRPTTFPVSEVHPLEPVDVNGINKLAAEMYHLLYGRIYGISTTCLRLTNVYGPRMRIRDARQTFIGWWLRQIVAGETIQVYGDGTQLRDLNYVADVVDALLRAGSSPEAIGQTYNLGSQPVSLSQLANLLVAMGDGGESVLVPFPPERKAIDIGSYCGDYSKIAAQLGWRPRMDLTQGLATTIAYYRQHYGRYV